MESSFTDWLESLAPEGETLLYVRQKPLSDPPTYHADGAMKATWPAFRPGKVRKDGAWYANTASFVEERLAERVSAAAANCDYCLVLVLDDIGTKSKTPPLAPTWVMETSAGNFQWGYAFKFDAQPKKGDFAAAVRAIADAGYTDPGACNPVRNFRIPGSVNTKQGRDAFEARLVEFHPEREFSLPEICAALGVTPGESLGDGPRPIKVQDDGKDDVFGWLAAQGMVYSRVNGEGWAGVQCPNAAEHTDGSPEGRYNPAMRAFCCLHGHCGEWDSERFLTWVASKGGPARERGLREELVQSRLAAALPEPEPEMLDDARRVIAEVQRKEAGRVEQAGWYERFAYVLPEDCYFDLQERHEVSRSAFNALFRHITCWSIHAAPGGRPKRVEAGVSFDENRQAMGARVVAGVTYAAGETTLCARDGLVYANRWRDARPSVSGGDASRWLAHVERMIPDAAEREHVLNVMAFKVQNPRIKVNHAILHGGTAGAGKDTMWAPFFWAIGGPARMNVALLENDRLQTQWGYHLEAEVIVINELRQADATDRRSLENRLKSIIAAPPELLVVERKGLHPYMVPNRAQVVAFTNERGAISLSADDRRWFVTWTHAPRMTPDEGKSFWAWLEKGGGFAAVTAWLHARDVSAFNAGAAPPWTDAKEAMLSAARPMAESWLMEQIQGRVGEFALGLISGPWGALCDRLQGLAPPGARIVPPAVLHALADAGWLDMGMCHSKTHKTKRHIFCHPDYRGTKAEARDALMDRPVGAGPLALVK